MAESDVFVRFGADIGPLEKGVNQANSKLSSFGSKSRDAANAMAKLAIAAAAAGAAIGAKLVNDSLQAIDAQAKLAKQLGTSSSSIATLSRAADMSGISMNQIEMGAKNLEVAMGDAAQGTGEAVETLKKLGLTAKDLEGMSLDQKLLTVNSALEKNIPANQRAAAAADLFGKKAGFAISQLNPEAISEAARQVEGMGLAISDVDAAKIEAANDAMASIGMAVDGVSQQLTIALAPILEDIALMFQEAAIEGGGFKNEVISAIDGIVSAVGVMANAWRGAEVIVEGVKVAFYGLKAAAIAVVSNIAEYLDSLTQGFTVSINEIISLANNIPGIDMSHLVVGGSEMVAGIRESAIEANVALQESMTALHNKMMEPLPSETIEAYIASFTDPAILEAKQIQADESLAITETMTAAEIAAEEKKSAALLKIQATEQAERKAGTAQFLGDLSTLTQSGNKKLLAIGKAASAMSIIMSTHEAAMSSYKWAASWGGPVAGGIAAGAAIAAGGIRLQALNSTNLGGGSVGGVSSGGGQSQSQTQAQQPMQQEQNKTLRIEGFDSGQLFTGDQLNSLAEKLVEYQEDGFRLVV